MSAFLDQLERELVEAARRDAPQPTGTRSRRSTLISVGVAAVVTTTLLAASINHRAAPRLARSPARAHGSVPLRGDAAVRGGASTAVTHGVSLVNCDYTLQRPQRDLPRLVLSTRSPGPALLDHVSVLRRPQEPSDRLDLADLDRDGLGVVEIYSRYTRLLRGPLGASIELVPALICPHSRHQPLLALLAVTADRPRTTLLWATAAQLAGGGRSIQFRSGAERVSATILAGGETQILLAPRTPGASGAASGLEA